MQINNGMSLNMYGINNDSKNANLNKPKVNTQTFELL